MAEKKSSIAKHLNSGKKRPSRNLATTKADLLAEHNYSARGSPIYYKLKWEPRDTAEQDKLAFKMVEWVASTDTVELDDFPLSLGINPNRFYKMADKNETVRDALEIVRSIIGCRLKKDCRDGNLSESYLFKLLALYDKQYDKMKRDMVTLAIMARSQGEVVKYIEFQPIPSSPLVPDKKTD